MHLTVKVADTLCTARVTQLADGLTLDLTDAFARYAENLADLLQRVRFAVIHSETQTQDIGLAVGHGDRAGRRGRHARL